MIESMFKAIISMSIKASIVGLLVNSIRLTLGRYISKE